VTTGVPRIEFHGKEGPKGPAGPTEWIERCPVLWCKGALYESGSRPLWVWSQAKVYVRLHSRWLLEHQGVVVCQCSR
jgi:hypothetical protein